MTRQDLQEAIGRGSPEHMALLRWTTHRIEHLRTELERIRNDEHMSERIRGRIEELRHFRSALGE